MKKQTNKKLKLSVETVRALPSTRDLEQVVGGMTTAVTCGCSIRLCTTGPGCGGTTI